MQVYIMKLSLQKLWLVGELLVFCAADGSVDKAELERKWGTDVRITHSVFAGFDEPRIVQQSVQYL